MTAVDFSILNELNGLHHGQAAQRIINDLLIIMKYDEALKREI